MFSSDSISSITRKEGFENAFLNTQEKRESNKVCLSTYLFTKTGQLQLKK